MHDEEKPTTEELVRTMASMLDRVDLGVQELREDMHETKGIVSGIDLRLVSVENRVENIENRVGGIENRVESIEQSQVVMQADISEVKGAVRRIENHLESFAETVTDVVTNFEDRLVVAEAKVSLS